MFLKKRKKRGSIIDKSDIRYWQNKLKPRMKLNNSKLHNSTITYRNFIVPDIYQILKDKSGIHITSNTIEGNSLWYTIYKDGISAEIIQEDFMSPTSYDLQA